MALMHCPECGHEISSAAVACPSCGRPVNVKPVAVPRVVEPVVKKDSVPPWVIAPVILLGVLVLFGLIYLLSSSDDSNTNVAVNVNRRAVDRTNGRTGSTDVAESSETTISSSSVPTTSSGTTGSSVPGASYPTGSDVPSSTTVPGSGVSAQPDRATVRINAKISTRDSRQPQPVRNTRFYLLDKDVESILDDAGLEPIEGQSLATSLAMAIANQGAYGSFYREAMAALKDHIKYVGSTDSNGQAQLGSVKPDSYYLFGVARSGSGFAIWNSPVSVNSGENMMNLSPQPVTDMPSSSGEEEEE